MQEFFTAISNYGFPIVVAGYLLFRFENKIDDLQKEVANLSQQVKELTILLNSKTRWK